MNIRNATIDDLETIISYKIFMFKDAKLEYLLTDNPEKIIYEKYLKLYENHQVQHFLYILNDRIVATAGAFIKEEIPYCFYKNNKYGFIGDMYTAPQYRKQGIAQQLLDKTIDWFKSNNINMIQLLASEAGVNLYKKNGFIENNELMSLQIMD